jgi:hypothetical protein
MDQDYLYLQHRSDLIRAFLDGNGLRFIAILCSYFFSGCFFIYRVLQRLIRRGYLDLEGYRANVDTLEGSSFDRLQYDVIILGFNSPEWFMANCGAIAAEWCRRGYLCYESSGCTVHL